MDDKTHVFEGRKSILHVRDRICTSSRDLLQSEIFVEILRRYWEKLNRHESPLRKPFLFPDPGGEPFDRIVELLRVLSGIPLEQAASMLPWAGHLTRAENRWTLHEFVESLYNYWRSLDRFMILHSEPGPSSFDQRPYRSFNATAENLSHIIRAVYRDICENITDDHPRVYRQVAAGCNVALIAVPLKVELPGEYGA
ncbi:MAG: hypothetical protein JXA52_06220, partial [Planctomycetes bacterium]|nr:hypothetical protein [Planctomycetota bacterium]